MVTPDIACPCCRGSIEGQHIFTELLVSYLKCLGSLKLTDLITCLRCCRDGPDLLPCNMQGAVVCHS